MVTEHAIAGGTAAISSGDAYKYPGVNYTGNYALKMLVLRGIIAGFTLKLIHKN